MHKQHKRKCAGIPRRQDANVRIPATASNAIVQLLTEWECGNPDPAVTYLKSEYLSKYCDEKLVPAAVRRQNAIDKWLTVEERNRLTNRRLREMDPGYNILPRVPLSGFLSFARRLTSRILGPLNDRIVMGSFSGGASTSRQRLISHPANKFADKAHATSEAHIFLDTLYREAPLLKQYGVFSHLTEVEGAVLFTVPKKTDIDRCACKEPDLNMFLQKGVGKHIRRRLQRFHIDLNDQSRNRSLAREGSLTGTLATLDLSSASDTISIECVKALLPDDWFAYLDCIRSRVVIVDGEAHRTAMFSSMGNGFTFELESLIFYVLARTTSFFEGVAGIISVYGDDIICPSRAYEALSWVLKTFGFEVNQEKSFHTGPFRESCGGHYHNGVDITPFYLKRSPSHLTDVIRVANQLRRWCTADPFRKYEVPSTYNLWIQLATLIPKGLWGGYDNSLDTQLVSPHIPNHRLSRWSDRRKLSETGQYLHWHNSNWNRSLGPDDESYGPVNTHQGCSLRRSKPGAPRTTDLFYQEE